MPIWTALIPAISALLDKLIPDPAARENARLALTQAENTAALQQFQLAVQADAAQTEIDRQEAQSPSLFVAGWRPFIGWVCGVAFAYHFIAQPLITYVMAACGHSFALPAFDIQELSTVLMGMLGLGGLRTIEKIKNVAQ
ncbi:MAG: hypothetical protein KGI29_06525 [Pseudomonadota bacterium]|nr:hypothetical protein [Pseudomonadota bacterium]MDE3038689.1 hypothetical protein [Pseudomonadota bacterium]